MGLGYARLYRRGISFYLSLLKHPFTGFAGASPRAGKRQVEAAETRRFPVYGVSAYTPMCPEGTEGALEPNSLQVKQARVAALCGTVDGFGALGGEAVQIMWSARLWAGAR